MKWLTLEYIKEHSRIDYDIEDDLLELYADSAEKQVLNDLGMPYSELLITNGSVPKDIVHASLMLVDFAYLQRSPVDKISWSVVPYTYEMLIKPYIRLASRQYQNPYKGAVPFGSQVKVLVTAELDEGWHLSDVDFSVSIYNEDDPEKAHLFTKSNCIKVNDDNYVVLVDTTELGIGTYAGRLMVFIPDTDYPGGTRTEITHLDTDVRVIM